MKQLTKNQRKVFEFIKLQIASNGYSPTMEDIQKYFKWKSTNAVEGYLVALEKKAYITRERRKARTIKILNKEIGGVYSF